MTLWVKPTENSYGMPQFFFPHFRLMSRIMRPFILLALVELKPLFEDQLFFMDYKMGGASDGNLGRTLFRYTSMIDYKGEFWHDFLPAVFCNVNALVDLKIVSLQQKSLLKSGILFFFRLDYALLFDGTQRRQVEKVCDGKCPDSKMFHHRQRGWRGR